MPARSSAGGQSHDPLIKDLLDVSRVIRGLVELDNVPLDIRHIVTEDVEQVAALMLSRRLHLALLLPPDIAMVIGDERKQCWSCCWKQLANRC